MKNINTWQALAAFAIIVVAVVVLIITGHANAITIATTGVAAFITALLPVLRGRDGAQ